MRVDGVRGGCLLLTEIDVRDHVSRHVVAEMPGEAFARMSDQMGECDGV